MKPVENITVFNNYSKLLVSFENSSFLEFIIESTLNEEKNFYEFIANSPNLINFEFHSSAEN